MSDHASEAKEFIESYLNALSGKHKTEEVIQQYVTDLALKEHIHQIEEAFPQYELTAEELVSDGHSVAFRGVFRGIHHGEFAAIRPTGKTVSANVMVFYHLKSGKIANHWMVIDMMSVINQLKA
jgi:predicted ester cyclase